MTKLLNLMKKNQGFTLVELIVVIAVLGILSGIAIPRLTGVQDKARYAAGEALLANLKTPLELYRVENDGYPEVESGNDYDGLEVLSGNNGYLDNLNSMLPKSESDANNEWYFVSYSLDSGSYTLEVAHPDTNQNLEMTPDGISKK